MNYNSKSESFTNIKRAFEDESAGHVRYMILGEEAEKQGNSDLAGLYRRLSEEELAHARIWYGEQGAKSWKDSLKDSIGNEGTEATNTYPSYAGKAELEGYEALADRFLANGRAEGNHRKLLMQYMTESENGSRYYANEESLWRCTVCGYLHTGTTPPEQCPLCGYNRTAYTKDAM